MFPAWLMVPSTLFTCNVWGRFRVPNPRDVTVRASMKLCVAPLSSRASVLVFLCHMCTETVTVIEFSLVLYMVARVAGVATFKTRQSKNPRPCRVRRDTQRALLQSFSLQVL